MRVPPTLKIVVLCLCLSVTVSGQSNGLLSQIGQILGNLPILGPLVGQLPLVGGLLSSDLLGLLSTGDDRQVRAIVRGDVATIQAVAARDGLRIVKVLDGLVVLEATPSVLQALQGVSGIQAISLDNLVRPTMSVSDKAMAADQARASSGGLLLGLLGTPAVTGRGIGVAVVDSGIAAHTRLSGKVVAAVNFATGETGTGDAFGHGTHIAGIIAGTASSSPTALFKNGIAPGAHLINVRVLGREGVGYTSDVIAGIQWVIANKTRYRIRVMNLSLGHPIVEPCALDPLCLTAERAVAEGLVVVASAGNAGKDAEGRVVLGSISTPGNAPGVITVGALNTKNTVTRDDDTVATYSSRGPTRFDMTMKPDLVAPGNKIVSLSAAGSYLAARYPDLHVAGSGSNAYSMMSGTSMAAAMISGGAALLLESAPTMTPRHVKVALQVTASPIPHEGLVSVGTGSANLYSARKVAGSTISLLGILPIATVAGRPVVGSGWAYLNPGAKLDQSFGRAGLRVFGLIDVKRTGLPSRYSYSGPAQILWGDVNNWSADQQILWGDQVMNPGGQQILWGDQVFNPSGQQILWGDQIYSPSGQQILWGDQTSDQQILWGDTTGGNQILWGDTTRGDQR